MSHVSFITADLSKLWQFGSKLSLVSPSSMISIKEPRWPNGYRARLKRQVPGHIGLIIRGSLRLSNGDSKLWFLVSCVYARASKRPHPSEKHE
jgi:hypothetical protein